MTGPNFCERYTTACYYNQFMCEFATLIAPLTALLAKKKLCYFGKRELCAFESLKKAL